MFEHVVLSQRFVGACYLRGPRHDLSIARLAKRLGGHTGLGRLFPLRCELRRTRHNVPFARRRPPNPAKSSITPTDQLHLTGVLATQLVLSPLMKIFVKVLIPFRGIRGHHKQAALGAQIRHTQAKTK